MAKNSKTAAPKASTKPAAQEQDFVENVITEAVPEANGHSQDEGQKITIYSTLQEAQENLHPKAESISAYKIHKVTDATGTEYFAWGRDRNVVGFGVAKSQGWSVTTDLGMGRKASVNEATVGNFLAQMSDEDRRALLEKYGI